MERDFQKDFLMPALRGLSHKQQKRVAIALDTAIVFGALEHADGNESLQDQVQVQAKYWQCVEKLK